MSLVASSASTLHKAARDGRYHLASVHLGNTRRNTVNELDKDGFAPIHYAARFNRLEVLEQLLAARADVNIKTKDGFTALHFAVYHLPQSQETGVRGKEDSDCSIEETAVHSLLQAHTKHRCKRVDVDAKNSYGKSPLHLACSRGNISAVVELMEHDSTCVKVTDNHRDTPLHEACLQGHLEIVQYLLSNSSLALSKNKDDEMPIHTACKGGHVEVVGQLLKPEYGHARTMLNATDASGNAPIHLAVQSGIYELIKLLVLHDVDLNAKNRDGVCPIHLAAAQGHKKVAKALLECHKDVVDTSDDKKRTPLHHAAMNDQEEMINYLLKRGANKEAVDQQDTTPLVLAAAWGKANAVKALIQGRAEVNTTDKDGKSAVYWAAQEGHVEVLEILLQHEEATQVSFASEHYRQNTPLHVAAWKGQTEAFKVLMNASRSTEDSLSLSVGDMFHVRNDEDRTPLHLAAFRGHLDIVQLIVERSYVSMTAEDKDGSTPLHLAAAKGRVEVVEYLIATGAKVEVRDGRHFTPLDCAADAGHVDVMSQLIDAKVPVNATTKASLSPLFLACQRGQLAAVQLLLEKGADVKFKDVGTGFNCLDIAIENGHKEVAMAIIHSPYWKDGLRNSVGMTTPMRRMIKKLPDVACAVLDRCLTDNATVENPDIVNSEDYELNLDFEFLEDWRPKVSRDWGREIARLNHRHDYYIQNAHALAQPSELPLTTDEKSTPEHTEENCSSWKPEGFSKANHPLSLMAKYSHVDLLRHPVVTGLLEKKEKQFGMITTALNLALHALFLLFLTLYALLLPHPDHVYCRSYSVVGSVSSLPFPNQTCPWANLTVARGDPTVPMTFAATVVLYIAAVAVIVIGGIRLGLEFFQAVKRHWRYFLNFENYIEDATYILAIVFVIQFGLNCWCPTSWQWQMGAVAVFLAWINLILFLKRVPLLGIYVLMYTNIVYTFLRVVIIAFLFVVAFSLAFYMILFKPVLPGEEINVSTFRTPGLSIIKTMVMTIGEFEYDTIFGNSIEARDQLTEFSGLAYFLWIIFLIMMSILLVNLLVGLAVDDTKAIQTEAHLQRIGIQVNLTLEAEELWTLLPQAIRPKLTLNHHKLRPNRRLNPWELFKDAWGVERWDSVDNIQKYQKPEPSVIDHIRAHGNKLASEIKTLKEEMSTITLLLKKIAEKQSIPLEENTDEPSDDLLSHL
jgi:ankyrin repeat protein